MFNGYLSGSPEQFWWKLSILGCSALVAPANKTCLWVDEDREGSDNFPAALRVHHVIPDHTSLKQIICLMSLQRTAEYSYLVCHEVMSTTKFSVFISLLIHSFISFYMSLCWLGFLTSSLDHCFSLIHRYLLFHLLTLVQLAQSHKMFLWTKEVFIQPSLQNHLLFHYWCISYCVVTLMGWHGWDPVGR